MCAFFNSSSDSNSYDFSILQTDIHAHLLPSIDDGPETHEKALENIMGLKKLGFKNLFATPHVMSDLYPNTSQKIKEVYSELVSSQSFKNIDIKLFCAAEYFLDSNFENLLQDNDLLTIGKNFVLVEMSVFSPSPSLNDILFELQTRGYQPILAHPERYIFLANDWNFIEDLKFRGCLFQCNLLSYSGYYGRKIKKMAWKLLKEGLVDFLSTDVHNQKHIEYLHRFQESSKCKEILSEYSFQNSLLSLSSGPNSNFEST